MFAAILLRAGELSQINTPLFTTIGSSNKYPVEKSINSDIPYKLKKGNFEFIPQRMGAGFIDYLNFESLNSVSALEAGQYDLLNGKKSETVSLNYNRQESDIKTINSEDLADLMKDKGYENVNVLELKEGQSKVKIDLNQPVTLWKWFLLFAILFYLVEIALIKFWKN